MMEHIACAERPPTGGDAPSLHAALLAGLDKLAHGVALLDESGAARFANASARSLWMRLGWQPISDGAPLRLPPCWAPALHKVCARGHREFLRTATANDTIVVAVLAPLPAPPANLAFVMFGRDELCGSVELQMFALRYQLTQAETTVLRKLCRGLNAASIALEHGVARTTVLTQIAAIRAKTQSTSVRSLLDALARMPPVRALVSAPEVH